MTFTSVIALFTSVFVEVARLNMSTQGPFLYRPLQQTHGKKSSGLAVLPNLCKWSNALGLFTGLVGSVLNGKISLFSQ